MPKDQNPYANKNGEPIKGHLHEFLQWSRQQELVHRQDETPELVAAIEESEQALSDRMNS